MTKGQIAGQTKQNVIADGKDAKDHELLHQVRIGRPEGLQPDRHGQNHDRQDGHKDHIFLGRDDFCI